MTILGFGMAHIFFQMCAMVAAAFFLLLTWEEKNLSSKEKQLITAVILVGWFGVAILINAFANFIVAERDNSCRSITHTINVEGQKVQLERYFVLCQDKDGRMIIKGPNGELKGQ